jgi:hypothetical protein
MRHAVTVMLMVCAVSSARADKAESSDVPDADPEDAKAARDVGAVITDGKGHYLAFTGPDPAPDPLNGVSDGRKIFYGDGKAFYLVEVHGLFSDQGVGTWWISDWRTGPDPSKSALIRKQGAYSMTCRTKDNVIALTPLSSVDARKLLAKAAFKERRMDRQSFALGRDGTTYYYVDVARRPEVNSDYRLYAGKRGAMKRLKLKRIDSDTDGVVLATKEGVLRIKITKKPTALSWAAKPSKQVDLTLVPTDINTELTYSELGVYAGKPFGVPCDDM